MGFNILICDDSALARKMARSNLPTGFAETIYEVSNGMDALEVLAHHTIDLVLLDLTMPILGGISVLSEIEITGTTVDALDCNDPNSGNINITVTGGSGVYDFLWSNGSITEDLNNGKNICLVSDAGTPSVSDPGFELIKNLDLSIDIIPIPGPSSLTATLSISQIPINKFMFLGFLPKKNKERKTQLNLIKNTLLPAVIFESKHRILSLLEDIVDVLGAEVQVAMMRELTKLHEEVIYDSASNLLDTFTMRPINGEITA